jgi:hypothetical protein
MSNPENYGVQITGSNVYGSAIAGGAGARAEARDITVVSHAADSVDGLRLAIAALVEQVRAAPPGIADPAALTQIAESVQAEADKDKPNKGMLHGLLAAVIAGAGGVASIANAAAAIQHAVSVLF